MPKYEVSMNLVEAKIAKFIVESKDEDEYMMLWGRYFRMEYF